MGHRRGAGGAEGPRTAATTRRDVLLALGRIALGGYWLWEQHWKLPPDFGLHQPRGLMFALQQSIRYPTLGLYKRFTEDVVVPHFHLFGWLVFLAEVGIGISLTLGAFTKAGALLGTLEAANLLVSQGRTPEGPWIYVALLAANGGALVAPTNRRLSVDRILAPRVERTMARRGGLLARVLRTVF
jgi:uncharacterized membrane protein YphA (DoxX/SURF4 family)